MEQIIKYCVSNVFSSPTAGEDIHDIVYSIDRHFLLGAAISATSLLINSNKKFNFHFFTDFLSSQHLEKFHALAKKFNTNVYLYIINTKSFADLTVKAAWTIATYYRFIAFHYLSATKNSALYLDADVVCKANPDALFDLNLGENYAAVVPDLGIVQTQCEARLGLDGIEGNYFNAGVIYLNLAQWKLNHLTEKALAMIGDKNVEYSFLDQDVLNILFYKKTILLPEKYNQIYDAAYHFGHRTLSEYKKTITSETIFIHYTSSSKPWLQWMRYPSSIYFDSAYAQSPWKEIPLQDAHTTKLLKIRSRHEYRQKKYLASLMTQIRYLTQKIRHIK